MLVALPWLQEEREQRGSRWGEEKADTLTHTDAPADKQTIKLIILILYRSYIHLLLMGLCGKTSR